MLSISWQSFKTSMKCSLLYIILFCFCFRSVSFGFISLRYVFEIQTHKSRVDERLWHWPRIKAWAVLIKSLREREPPLPPFALPAPLTPSQPTSESIENPFEKFWHSKIAEMQSVNGTICIVLVSLSPCLPVPLYGI